MDKSWGPWIEHDGTGCPCVGAFAEAELYPPWIDTKTKQAIVVGGPQWGWENAKTVTRETQTKRFVVGAVIRYRVRKPRAASTETGMAILREIADRELHSDPVRERVQADTK